MTIETKSPPESAETFAARLVHNGHDYDVALVAVRARDAAIVSALQDRVHELRLWAYSRIQTCRSTEARLGPKGIGMYEAAQERRTLQAVLEILDLRRTGDDEPREKP
jgi:hypothetical protein